MTPEQWDQARQLFEQALDRGPAERDAFLKAACREDVELRVAVEELLNAPEPPDTFLAPPVGGAIQDLMKQRQRSSGTEDEISEPNR